MRIEFRPEWRIAVSSLSKWDLKFRLHGVCPKGQRGWEHGYDHGIYATMLGLGERCRAIELKFFGDCLPDGYGKGIPEVNNYRTFWKDGRWIDP